MSAYQRAVTFNHSYVFGGSPLTNFPVIVGGTYSFLATVANGGRVINSSGIDIYFTSDSAGTVLLPFERVAYNPSTGACEFWVQIPSLSNSVNTVFYINYGDSSVTADLSSPTSVWDSNHVAVYHFGNGATLNCNDSTSYANNGTNHGATATGSLLAQGQGAAHFTKASSQYIDCGTGASLNLTTALTMEVCITANSSDTNVGYIGKGYGNSNGYDARTDGGWDLGWALRSSGTEVSRYQSSIGLGTCYLAFTYNGSTGTFYYDNSGSNNFSSPLTNSWSSAIGNNASIPLRIGAFSDLSAYFDGTLDEVRISNVARSAGWIQTQAWQSGVPGTSPNISYSVGSEGSFSGGGVSVSISDSPATGQQGQTLTVTITGTNTFFASGVTTVSLSGSGATVSGVSVSSATSLTFTLTLAGSAATGARTLTVTTGSQAPTATFTITPGARGNIDYDQIGEDARDGASGTKVAMRDTSGTLGNLVKYGTDGKTLVDSGVAALAAITNPMTTLGDVIVGGTSGAAARLGVGSNGKVLTANSSATDGIDYEAPIALTTTGTSGAATLTPGNPYTLNVPQYSGGGGSGGLTLLNTLTASNSASLSDTTSITSTYDEYELHFLGIIPVTNGASLLMRFSTNGGSSYDSGSNYAHATIGWATTGSATVGSQSDTSINIFNTGIYNTSPRSSSARRTLYLGSGLYPTMHGTSQHVTAADQPTFTAEGDVQSAVYKVNSAAVNAFQFFMSSGNISSGVIRIYGVAK